jgi:hypothetical protein
MGLVLKIMRYWLQSLFHRQDRKVVLNRKATGTISKHTPHRGYGLALLTIMIASMLVLATSMQIMLGSTSTFQVMLYPDFSQAGQVALRGLSDGEARINSNLASNTAISVGTLLSSVAVSVASSPSALAGGKTQIGTYTVNVTGIRGNAYFISSTGIVGSSTATMTKVVQAQAISPILDQISGAQAAYSLRRLRSAYAGSAIKVRRLQDNSTMDIGFTANGDLDMASLQTFLTMGDTLPLDQVSGGTVAYGLRRLRSAYTGSAIQVRRSSDNSVQNIGFNPMGDLDVVALMDFTGTGSAYISIWYDQSGNGTNATQATTSLQPSIVTSGVLNIMDGRPAIKYDGVDDTMRFNRTISDDFSILSCFSINAGSGVPHTFDVAPYDAWTEHSGLIDEEVATTTNDFGSSVDNTGRIYAGVGNPAGDQSVSIDAPGYNDNDMHWMAFIRQKVSGQFTLFGDNTSYSRSGAYTGSSTAATTMSLGRLLSNNTPSINGYINEVLIYNSALSNANRQALQKDEGRYYNMQPSSSYTSFLLDTTNVPAANAAYSLRQLTSNNGTTYCTNPISYPTTTGVTTCPAIQVRDGTTGTSYRVGFVNGVLDVATLLTNLNGHDGYINKWYDQSGSKRDLSQATNANQPQIVSAGQIITDPNTGYPAAYFNGSQYITNGPDGANNGLGALPSGNSTRGMVAAYSFATAPGSPTINTGEYVITYGPGTTGTESALGRFYSSSGTIQPSDPYFRGFGTAHDFAAANGLTASTNDFPYDTLFKVSTFITDGTNARAYKNGLVSTSSGSLTLSTTLPGSSLSIGGRSAGTFLMTGYISEALIFNSNLNYNDGSPDQETARKIIERNILQFYNPNAQQGYITTWYDQSGNANDLTQTNPALQPVIVVLSDGANKNYPTIFFNGNPTNNTGSFLYSTVGFPINSDYTTSSVFSYRDVTGYNNIFSGRSNGTNSHAVYMYQTPTTRLFQGSDVITPNSPLTVNVQYAIASTFVNSSKLGALYQKNASIGSGTAANGVTDPTIEIGAWADYHQLNGTESEGIAFNRVLSATELSTLYMNQLSYFGCQ